MDREFKTSTAFKRNAIMALCSLSTIAACAEAPGDEPSLDDSSETTSTLTQSAGPISHWYNSEAGATITEANDDVFMHSGSHSNQARTYMCGNPTRDAGIVIVFNADIVDGTDRGSTNETIELRDYILDQFTSTMGFVGNCR